MSTNTNKADMIFSKMLLQQVKRKKELKTALKGTILLNQWL